MFFFIFFYSFFLFLSFFYFFSFFRLLFLQELQEMFKTAFKPFHWLMIQESPTLFSRDKSKIDIFQDLLIKHKILVDDLPVNEKMMPIFLDECQILCTTMKNSCCSSNCLKNYFNFKMSSSMVIFEDIDKETRSAISPITFFNMNKNF